MDEEREKLRAKTHMLNPAMWILDSHFVNENQQPFEFDLHRFMLQPYADSTPDQVIMKSAQIGWSVAAILKSIHAAKFIKLNVIYILPTRNASAEFVVPKVNPMIKRNPAINAMVQNTDNKSLKQVGDRFIYFKGAFHEGEAISTSADLIVADEYDRSDQNVLSMYQSRLQASKFRWFWKFSNPSLPGFGVHELFQESDQMHWVVTCPHCGHEMTMEIDRDDVKENHYIAVICDERDKEEAYYACGHCHMELTDDDRQSGRWIPRYPGRKRRGYHISQLIVPWVSASHIIKQRNDMTIDVFHNMVLGLPYQASEFLVNREAILANVMPGIADKTKVFMGVDVGKIKHWVLGNKEGIFAYGLTDDWDEIERIFNHYNAVTVIDALPDFTIPAQFAEKYRGRVFVHYYSLDSKRMEVSVVGENMQEGVIQSDKTKIFDQVARDIANHNLKFFMSADSLERYKGNKDSYIYHWENMYRIVEADARGIEKGRWETKNDRPDHWPNATIYYKVAVNLGVEPEGAGASRPPQPAKKEAITVDPVTMSVPSIDIKEAALQSGKPRKVKV